MVGRGARRCCSAWHDCSQSIGGLRTIGSVERVIEGSIAAAHALPPTKPAVERDDRDARASLRCARRAVLGRAGTKKASSVRPERHGTEEDDGRFSGQAPDLGLPRRRDPRSNWRQVDPALAAAAMKLSGDLDVAVQQGGRALDLQTQEPRLAASLERVGSNLDRTRARAEPEQRAAVWGLRAGRRVHDDGATDWGRLRGDILGRSGAEGARQECGSNRSNGHPDDPRVTSAASSSAGPPS